MALISFVFFIITKNLGSFQYMQDSSFSYAWRTLSSLKVQSLFSIYITSYTHVLVMFMDKLLVYSNADEFLLLSLTGLVYLRGSRILQRIRFQVLHANHERL
jgi:hypothetical protein